MLAEGVSGGTKSHGFSSNDVVPILRGCWIEKCRSLVLDMQQSAILMTLVLGPLFARDIYICFFFNMVCFLLSFLTFFLFKALSKMWAALRFKLLRWIFTWLRADMFWRTILHFIWSLHTDTAHVIEISPCGKQRPTYLTRHTQWLLLVTITVVIVSNCKATLTGQWLMPWGQQAISESMKTQFTYVKCFTGSLCEEWSPHAHVFIII